MKTLIGLLCIGMFGVMPAALAAPGAPGQTGFWDQANDRVQQTPAWQSQLARERAAGTGWELLWSDEFDGDEIDGSKWGHEVNCWGGGNNERQCYTDRADNSYVDDGLLHIVAKEEQFTGPALQDDDPGYPGGERTQDYTSARLRTKGKFDFTYGRVDIRAKVPGGQGMWPALWMLPEDNVYGTWPLSGEIDIFEAVNLRRGDFAGWGDTIHGTLHYGLPWPQWTPHGQSLDLDENPADDFHTYSIEWEADEIRWYLDGEHWQTQTSDSWHNWLWLDQNDGFGVANDRAPFDQAFHLIMNVAVGGDWPRSPDSGWDADREMLVDYVRVYQCGTGSSLGTGCETVDPSVEVNAAADAPGVETWSVYDGGVGTLALAGGYENTPVPGQYAFPGVTVSSETVANGAWSIGFEQTGNLDWGAFVGNVFLTAEDLSSVEGLANGLSLAGGSGWTTNGELSFDMKVKSIDEATSLFVKMDSVHPRVGAIEIDVPAKGSWQRVAVRISDLLANAAPEPLRADNINNLFVLESTGPAEVLIDNIELSCAVNTRAPDWQSDQTCQIEPREQLFTPEPPILDVYSDGISQWPVDASVTSGSVDIAEVDAGEPYGNVMQFSYSSHETVTYFQSSSPMDLSAWADGTVNFDLRVLEPGSSSTFVMKVDCVWPCGSGDFPIGTPTPGVWESYSIPVADLLPGALDGSSLDLSKVNTPLVIFPAWGAQSGAVFQVDNVRWEVGL